MNVEQLNDKITSLTTSVQKLLRYKIHQITQDYIKVAQWKNGFIKRPHNTANSEKLRKTVLKGKQRVIEKENSNLLQSEVFFKAVLPLSHLYAKCIKTKPKPKGKEKKPIRKIHQPPLNDIYSANPTFYRYACTLLTRRLQ